MSTSNITDLLTEAFPDCNITTSGEGCNLTVTIVGSVFTGLNRVKRQQMVYAVLENHIKSGEIHALTIKASTPEEHTS